MKQANFACKWIPIISQLSSSGLEADPSFVHVQPGLCFIGPVLMVLVHPCQAALCCWSVAGLMAELLLLFFAAPLTHSSALQVLSRPSGQLPGWGSSTSQGLLVAGRAGADATPMSHWEGCQPLIAAMVHLLLFSMPSCTVRQPRGVSACQQLQPWLLSSSGWYVDLQ